MIVSRSSNTATYGEVTENFRTDVENTLAFKAFSLFKPSTPKVINFKFHTCKFFFRISLLEMMLFSMFLELNSTCQYLSLLRRIIFLMQLFGASCIMLKYIK